MPRTALQWASLDGDALRVRWLLSSGENPNADDWVRRPLTGFLPLPACLLDRAPGCPQSCGGSARLRLARCVQSGRTALHYGCKKGHATVVRLLLAAKADILSKDGAGLTPKELATKNSKDQVVDLL